MKAGRHIKIVGSVTLKQGDKVIFKGKLNHFVQYGLMNMANLFSINALSQPWNTPAGNRYSTDTGSFCSHNYTYTGYLDVGDDVATPTVWNTIALVNSILLWSDRVSGAISESNPSAGVYRIVYTNTWAAGILVGTIGELGLWLTGWNALQTAGGTPGYPLSTPRLFSRLSVADGDFTAHPIDPGLPVTVNWQIDFTFV